MELNEIKKALYKQNPTAIISKITKSGLLYDTSVQTGGYAPFETWEEVSFLIPLEEIGDAVFRTGMEAKLLIRWIIQ